MNLFMSWSGDRSRNIAEIMKEWIESIFPSGVKVWLSTQGDDVNPGSLAMVDILKGLQKCEYGIFCFTNDNTHSLWMMFEGGALCKQNEETPEIKGIYTILFEGNVQSLEKTPLKHFQHTSFTKNDVLKLFENINKKVATPIDTTVLRRNVNNNWDIFCPKIAGALKNRSLCGSAISKKQLMEKLSESYFGRPHPGQVTFYEKGFEDYPLYEILLKNVKKRLWIFGRKNRKIFDSRNDSYFEQIKTNPDFDFRCLFLDPDAPKEILSTAQDTLEFSTKLKLCINDASSKVKSLGLNPSHVIRLYSAIREYAIIVVDDVVLFSPILYKKAIKRNDICAEDPQKPEHLTQAAFNLVSVDEEKAKYHVEKFESTWDNAKPISVE